MTDPRLGDRLLAAVQKLPMGSGVVFRHYDLPEPQRLRLFQQVAQICRRRGNRLLLAGAGDWNSDGVHNRIASGRRGIVSLSVHNVVELRKAKRLGADMIFLSPLYATRSHPGARPMGMMHFACLARLASPMKVIALGGMTHNRARMINPTIAHGWAAIDAFLK